MKFVDVAVDFFRVTITTKVSDRKSMKFVDVAVDFFRVAITAKVSDRQSVKPLTVAVDSSHAVTAEAGDWISLKSAVCVAITQVGMENFVEVVMGPGMLVRLVGVGAPVTLSP